MMIRPPLASPRAPARSRLRTARRRVAAAGLAGLSLLAAAAVPFGRSPAVAAATCDRSATPSSLASEVSAASAGQTICLETGDYGTWNGTNKALTITAASGASPQMTINFGSGDSGFTLDGMRGMS